MVEYGINVLLTFAGYLPLLILIVLASFIGKRVEIRFIDEEGDMYEFIQAIRNGIKYIGIGFLMYAIFMSFMSQSITYKNQTFNPAADQAQAKTHVEERADAAKRVEIKDITRQPKMSDDTREQDFKDLVDWRSKSQQ